MNKKIFTTVIVLQVILSEQIISQTISIKDAWARPASKGRNSAVYFTIINNNISPDTLLKASSDIAEKTEIHETFKRENNMMGMRAVKFVSINPKSELKFKPGGFHIMLIGLKKNLAEKDTLILKLKFKHTKDAILKVPVNENMPKN